MAGRIVVLEFDDRRQAEAFLSNEEAMKHDGARPLAEFYRPNQFCECPDSKRQNASNWRRGKRTGLQVCVRCGKPSIFHHRGIVERLCHIFGTNQLAIEPDW